MVKLCFGKNHMTIATHQEFLVFLFDTGQSVWNYQTTVLCSENTEKTSNASIEACTYSPCGKYFGLCFNRLITIYDTTDWKRLSSILAERRSSSLRFFPQSNAILLADKSGCATFYSFKDNKLEKTEPALGHNSMLTSALVTDCEKFIITCDRDEKIRITNYLNVYNIESYCLGHKMFVSCIDFLPTDSEVLVSGSGDGTVRFWDYVSGKELAQYNFNGDNTDENSKVIITKLAMCKTSVSSIVAVLEYKSNQIRILNVRGDKNTLQVQLSDILKLDCAPWDIGFYCTTFICLMPNKLSPLFLKSFAVPENSKIQEIFRNIKKYLIENWDSFVKMTNKISDDIPVLFKREVDNIQEYEQRKRARLLRTGKTS